MRNKGWLIGFVAFQALILVMMVLKSMLPLLFGHEVILEVQARDPREIFRGNYVALNYSYSFLDITEIANDLQTHEVYHYGDVLYLELQPADTFWSPAGLWKENQVRKAGNRNLRVIVQESFTVSPEVNLKSWGQRIHLSAGIESYFAPKDKALEIEEQVRRRPSNSDTLSQPVRVRLMLLDNGEARIKEILLPPN